ncbi:hypothetical protein MJM04_36095, partial [Salmonella enterica subsp. enterica serovar Cerro]|nr:hypothetical protein [Salmonella enterica subsp. enterica serovar Cerro]
TRGRGIEALKLAIDRHNANDNVELVHYAQPLLREAGFLADAMKSPFRKKPLFIQILFLSNWRRITKRCSKQFVLHKKMTYRSS